MSDFRIKLVFEGSTASANMLVEDAKRSVSRSIDRQGMTSLVSFCVEKSRSDTMDAGTILVLLLGTPALIAVANGIKDFISMQQDIVTITTENGTVVARGSAAKNIDVAATVAALKSANAALKASDAS